jgi:two-component system sensor histidine kinase DegS
MNKKYDGDLELNAAPKKLEAILEQMVTTIDEGREQIYSIADEARAECTQLQTELAELRYETAATITEVELFEREEKQARVRLMQVSQDFDAYTEEDIEEAYKKAREAQIKLFTLREKERQLRQRRDDLERHLQRVESIARRAERLVERINVVFKMLAGNVDTITGQLEESYKKQQLGVWLIHAQEEERRRVSRELHDGPAQNLANIVMRLELMERLWDRDQKRVKKELANLKDTVRQNLADIRCIIFDLRPMALDDLGLVPALKRYLADYSDKYEMDIDFLFYGEERRLDLAREVAVFRMIQEAITNVRKHAGTDRAQVKLEIAPENIIVIVRDRGFGFDVDKVRGQRRESFGLLGMQERVGLFGGEFKVKSTVGQGTKVIIEVPVKGEGKGDG